MAKNIYQTKGNFKSFLFVLAVVLAIGFLYYTQLLVNELEEQTREYLKFRIKVFEENINRETVEDLSFFFQEVIQQADYPIIYTDAEMNPLYWRNIDIPPIPPGKISPDTLAILKKLIAEFDRENPPIPISYKDQVLGYYHYGESPIIYKLRWLPFIEVIAVALFILMGYAGFKSIKKSEERFIWVGMAKETAHQLGTPLSSLMGWVAYLKEQPEQVQAVLPELEKDLRRLQTITNRFSQIGSRPDLKEENVLEVVQETVEYFQRRLPRRKKDVVLETELPDHPIYVQLNRDLLSWVLENLIKNALDALNGKPGRVSVMVIPLNEEGVAIEVQDTGRGIASKFRKTIFNPGFTTKKRGWGLGLSLVKRIVEEYHHGKVFVKESQPGKTVFRVELRNKGK